MYDAIVVGGGPAGSATAIRLADAGASVLLLDRARFPRDKPCGGGLTGRAWAEAPADLGPVVERVVSKAELRDGAGRRALLGRGAPIAYMTQRLRLDHHLVECAAAAGATVQDGTRVRAVAADGDGVAVTAEGERIRGRLLFGADGANGLVARSLGLGALRAHGVALEANLPLDRWDGDRSRLVLELGTVPGGYRWIFPKGDHLNVGVGGWSEVGGRLRDDLSAFCAAEGIPFERLESIRGHRLPLRDPRSTLARGRAAVLGDAAGLIDPLTGDGMYECFLGARLATDAATAVLAGTATDLRDYGRRVTVRLAGHLWASWLLKALIDRSPTLGYRLAKWGPVWNVIEDVLTGALPELSEARGPRRLPLAAVGLAGRLAARPPRAPTLPAPVPAAEPV